MRRAAGSRGLAKVKTFEKKLVDQGMNDLTAKRKSKAKQKANREEFGTEALRKQKKLDKHMGHVNRRLEQGIITWADDPDAYIEGYVRYIIIKNGNSGYDLARRRYHKIDENELRMLMLNPEVFPNLRLAYSYLTETYWIDWDGKN